MNNITKVMALTLDRHLWYIMVDVAEERLRSIDVINSHIKFHREIAKLNVSIVQI